MEPIFAYHICMLIVSCDGQSLHCEFSVGDDSVSVGNDLVRIIWVAINAIDNVALYTYYGMDKMTSSLLEYRYYYIFRF